MRFTRIQKVHVVFLFCLLSVTWSVRTNAQPIRFVQITDPHLFDSGDDGVKNKAALTSCIQKLNERADEHAEYVFAVVTGDIGIENLVTTGKDQKGDSILETDKVKREQRLEQGAFELASILSQSKIRVWLFLPGNNDLVNEEPDTRYYRLFLEKLRGLLSNLEIVDLCPEEPKVDKLQLGVYRLGSSAFIGFDDASFKNNNVPGRVAIHKKEQLDYVDQVATRIAATDVRNVYVFYHIPELDDPYIVLDGGSKRTLAVGIRYQSSSWFVDQDIYDKWTKLVVTNEKVRGLFAGHYHDWRRDTYEGYHWMQTSNYSSGSLSKLYISPPLAVKRQQNTQTQARGFQEVMIDGTGAVNRKIWWIDPANQGFDTDPSSKSNELDLALYYENSHEWSQAESHFAEAIKTAPSTNIRHAALAGMARVREAQRSWLKVGQAWAPTVLIVGAVLLIALILWLAIRQGFYAMVIHPFEGNEELAKLLAFGFPATRAKISKILGTPDDLVKSVTGVYPFVFPHMNDLFPGQSFEIMGISVPDLNVLLRWINRPRFQITGGISELFVKQLVYAELWRRSWWFGTRLVDHTVREIPWGYEGRLQVEYFIIDVYLRANASLRIPRSDS